MAEFHAFLFGIGVLVGVLGLMLWAAIGGAEAEAEERRIHELGERRLRR